MKPTLLRFLISKQLCNAQVEKHLLFITDQNSIASTLQQQSYQKKSDQTPKESTDTSEHHDIGAYNDVYCYFWDETQGQRGANEIGSCVLDYLEVLNAKHEGKAIHVTFYSDNCCGQNKNKYIISLYSYAVYKFQNIHSITHKYLIKGHTQNEGESVHSLIEKEIQKRKKSGPVYAPSQYAMLIANSKNGKPFIIKELTFNFFRI